MASASSASASSLLTTYPDYYNDKNITTAACLIIGDEVLNSKTFDTNSAFFARFCWDLGIDLRRVEIIPDVESEIIEAVTRLNSRHDFVITSGGIGPTHDDITYPSIAKAFNKKLVLHDETVEKMKKLNKRPIDWSVDNDEKKARLRMAQFPEGAQVIFPVPEELWVPVVKMENVHILPGIPRLFTTLLTSLTPLLSPHIPSTQKRTRLLVSTSLPESAIAPFLTRLSERVEPQGIKIGSYPKWQGGVMVSLIGREAQLTEELIGEVEREVQGRRADVEAEMKGEEERRKEINEDLGKRDSA
ncbi:Molybdopterin binding protein [Saitoella complicata NRRL Y-17804]|nr:Molybdopterin binding protein [Saitoella complicata NRRL Y-17804]ODQ52200.1 Molybdopterin binding protein [Saitoella complicata NRRL Y-17804]